MSEIIETVIIENEELRIFQDEEPESPRKWDNFGHMVCWHRRYELGDLEPKQMKIGYIYATYNDIRENRGVKRVTKN